ncbi:MAG: phage tail protein [Ktedonobacteraceae bacterium]
MKQTEIAQLLPAIFQQTLQQGTPLSALLNVMEALPAADEGVLDQLEGFFNPHRTPDNFVPFLASWVDMEWLFLEDAEEFTALTSPLPSGMGRLRELVASATFLAQWRGTAKGLLRFLETASGVQGFTVNERVSGPDGRPRPFHIVVQAPAEAAPYQAMLKRIIESEKPAYVTYDLTILENPAPQNGNTL